MPCWQGHTGLLRQLFPPGESSPGIPGCDTLNRYLANRIEAQAGKPIRFVPASQLPGVDYEQQIFRSGEVSTREENWHDLFNALAWARFPCLKAALNARHLAEIGQGHDANRGPVRDALTLFDECGAIVAGDDLPALQALARRDWPALFREHRAAWQQGLEVHVVGHALLEKFLQPYKAITAQVLVFRCDRAFLQGDRETRLARLDSLVGQQVSTGQRLRSSAELSPLPLMGIPGWWPCGAQDDAFYADNQVFRPPADGLRPAALLDLESET